MKTATFRIIINVRGEKSVNDLSDFLEYIGIVENPVNERNDWGGLDIYFRYKGVEFGITDYIPLKEKSGGYSDNDNMISFSLYRKTAEEAVDILRNFFESRSYNVKVEKISEGSYKVIVPDLFVDFKFNVLSFY